jgi:hypothetical protein
MTHVWQNQNVGPVYLGHAIFSQAAQGDAAYNYGYNTGDAAINIPKADYAGNAESISEGFATGEGGQDELNAKTADQFMEFSPEQQGQIMMQYFVRRELLQRPPANYAPWQKFVNFVQSHPQVA